MSRRTKIIILIIAGASLIFALILLLVGRRAEQKKGAPVSITGTQTPPAPVTPPVKTPPAPAANSLAATQDQVMGLARTFSERYGSYGPETQFQNWRDLRPLMTARLQNETEALIVKNGSVSAKSINVRALNAMLSSWSETTAEARVQTQREEDSGGAAVVTYPFFRVSLMKEVGVWKVDMIAQENK